MGAVTPGRTVDLVLYPSEHFGVPALPEFPKDSRTRLRSAVARCQAKLFPQLKRIWAGVVPEGCRAPSGSYEQFIPSFIGYSEGLFEVFARELSLLEADPDQFQQLLDKSLVWRITYAVAPLQPPEFLDYDLRQHIQSDQGPFYGDWMGLIHRSWFAFYHSHHGRLSRAVAKHFIDALLNFEKQQRVCEEIYRALLGQVPHEVERKSEKVKGPTKQQGHDGKITSSTELTRSLPKKRGRRRIDESHQNKLAAIIAPHMEGNGWMKPDILEKICQKLDKARVPGASDRLWKRVLEDDHSTGTHRVTDNIKYRLYKSPNPARNYLPK